MFWLLFHKTDMTANAVITSYESQMAPRLRRSRHLPLREVRLPPEAFVS